MRLLAIDFGTKKCGVAISDPLQIIAQPLKTIFYENNDFGYLIDELEKIIIEYKPIEKIIIGITKNIDGSISNTGNIVLKFKKNLESKFTTLSIVLVDEKYTTNESKQVMTMAKLSIDKKKQLKDAIAAQKILERYMNES